MQIAVLANQVTMDEILAKQTAAQVEFIWVDSMSSLTLIEADAYFDLQFDADPERTEKLKRLLPAPVFVNAVTETLKQLGDNRFIRVNAWPGMLLRPVAEIAFAEAQAAAAGSVMETLGWKFTRVPDSAGMVTPRIIAMIINEAFFALGEEVSSKEQIDLAMKLGTGYPFGPFEWAEKIGPGNIIKLLKSLNAVNHRYEIAPALLAEAGLLSVITKQRDNSGTDS